MKDYILNLLDRISVDDLKNENSFDIAFLQDVLQKSNDDQAYYNKILLDFDEAAIAKIVAKDNNSESFLASLIYIKSLEQLNQNENIEIPISDSQREDIGRFIYLIKQFIDNYETDIDNQRKQKNKDIESLKKRLKNNKPLNKNDYYIIEMGVKKFEIENSNRKLDEIMSFLNEYNYKIIFKSENNSDGLSKGSESNDDFNYLAPQSFEFVKEKKKKLKKEFDFLEKLDINPDLIYSDALNIVNAIDDSIKKNMVSYIKKIKLNKNSIISLINRGCSIFVKPFDNFKSNCELILSYNGDLDLMIRENISFFFNSYEYNKNKISIFVNNELNIEELLKIIPKIFAISTNKLLKNFQILDSYGFSFREIDYESLSVIGNDNIDIMLDFFIESSFSNYIFSGNEIKNLKSLIIKRLYYAYKNDLNIWQESLNDYINEEYNDYIRIDRKPITEEEIRYLISDYPILDSIEEGKRPILFGDATTAKIKRKHEFKFNNTIISRLKTYSVFKVLVQHNVDESKALFYALIYNSNLDEKDYLLIRKMVLGD